MSFLSPGIFSPSPRFVFNSLALSVCVSLTQPYYFQETARLENEAFVQKQKVALASEVKAVLDSWVRFEQQAKESEQAELVKTVIDNVLKSIRDEKTQKDILVGAVAEVERECFFNIVYGSFRCSLLFQNLSRASRFDLDRLIR